MNACDSGDALPAVAAVADDSEALPLHRWRLDAVGLTIPGRQPFTSLLTPAGRALWELTVWPVLKHLGVADEVMLELGDERQPLVSYWRRIADASDEGTVHYRGIAVPGRERQAMQHGLRLARRSLDSMPGAVLQAFLRDDDLVVEYAGGNLLDLLGLTPTRAMNVRGALLEAIEVDGRVELLHALSNAAGPVAGRNPLGFHALVRGRSTRRALQVTGSRQTPADPWHCLLIDVTERERLLGELREVAETDHLTRLANRRALLARIGQDIQRARRFAVLVLNCDRFQQVNNGLGHNAGDTLLRQVAERLDGLCGDAARPPRLLPAATFAARHSGDEFVLLVPVDEDSPDLRPLATAVVDTMATPYRVGDLEIVLTVSCGVAVARVGDTAEQVLSDAGTAMHQAKREGRNRRVVFEPSMKARAAQLMRLDSRLRQAVAEDKVTPVFQPIACVSTGEVLGFEALARWHDPVFGHVSPEDFIPLAEESGVISQLSERLLRQACDHFMRWQHDGLLQREGTAHRLSVNLSRAQLVDHALPRRILALVTAAGMAPGQLQLEITESMAMLDEGIHEVLAELREAGFRLSLDDFGTGHSSLAALSTLPVHQVKLDRSFIAHLPGSPYHTAVIQAAVRVAAALALEVVAEGVEREEQARALLGLGCTRAQGWLYGRPLPAEEIPALLRQRRRARV